MHLPFSHACTASSCGLLADVAVQRSDTLYKPVREPKRASENHVLGHTVPSARERHLPRACRSRATTRSQQAEPKTTRRHAGAQVPTFRELQDLAKARNLVLTLKTVGLLYKIECRDGHIDGTLVATTNGFTVPGLKLMHCDTMRIFASRLSRSDRERVFGGGLFGLGLLVVAAIMSHGHACGCTKAEMLAINDNDYQHKRLVKYYTRLGFQYVREVGSNGLADLPDLLVWGGAGTRMNCNPEAMLQQWFPLLQRMARIAAKG